MSVSPTEIQNSSQAVTIQPNAAAKKDMQTLAAQQRTVPYVPTGRAFFTQFSQAATPAVKEFETGPSLLFSNKNEPHIDTLFMRLENANPSYLEAFAKSTQQAKGSMLSAQQQLIQYDIAQLKEQNKYVFYAGDFKSLIDIFQPILKDIPLFENIFTQHSPREKDIVTFTLPSGTVEISFISTDSIKITVEKTVLNALSTLEQEEKIPHVVFALPAFKSTQAVTIFKTVTVIHPHALRSLFSALIRLILQSKHNPLEKMEKLKEKAASAQASYQKFQTLRNKQKTVVPPLNLPTNRFEDRNSLQFPLSPRSYPLSPRSPIPNNMLQRFSPRPLNDPRSSKK